MTAKILLTGALGDLVTAIPIAGFLRDNGYDEILWPILPRFYPTAKACAPWISWIALPFEPGEELIGWGTYFDQCGLPDFYKPQDPGFFNLFDILPSRDETDLHLKFDQCRYAIAKVPFLYKWELASYITRYPEQETELLAKVTTPGMSYVVTHLQGSSSKITLDLSSIEAQNVQVVNIVPGLTDNAFNWLGVIEGAQALYMYDSLFANIVDQMKITIPKIFFRRSKMQLTPVMGMNWEFRGAPADLIEQTETEFINRGYSRNQYLSALKVMENERNAREALLKRYGL